MKRNRLMKKGAIIVSAMALMLSLYGCGKNNEGSKKLSAGDDQNTTQESMQNTDATTEKTSETTEEVLNNLNYEAVYAPVLDENRDIVLNGYDDEKEYNYLSNGIVENAMYRDKNDLLNNLGYVIMDINGDGVSELLIGEDMSSDYENPTDESYIYSGYTYKDGEIVCFLEGWARSSYRWMGDGNFFYFGSSSAMCSMFGQCHLDADSSDLEWDDFYYSDVTDDGRGVGFYHNTSGIVDASASEELDVLEEDFWNLADNYKCEVISWNALGSDPGIDVDTSVDNDLVGTWLFPSGASISMTSDCEWELYTDEGDWVFGGNWESEENTGKVTVKFFSEVGDAGNYQVALGTMYYDPSGYPAMDIDFEKGLTDFTNGTITMSKGL